jgi:dolichyl-phosphate-mannose--protein O-mannosyl transferase
LLVGVTAGFSYPVLLHSMAVLGAASLLVAYLLLRRLQRPVVAAVVCLQIASSSLVFVLTTRRLMSDVPFLDFVMAAPYSARRGIR